MRRSRKRLKRLPLHPLDSTALAAAVSIPGSVEIGNLTPGTDDAGPAKTEDRRGMKSHGKVQCAHRRGKEFPEPRRGESEYGPGHLI